jgi:hypothetical protein
VYAIVALSTAAGAAMGSITTLEVAQTIAAIVP